MEVGGRGVGKVERGEGGRREGRREGGWEKEEGRPWEVSGG